MERDRVLLPSRVHWNFPRGEVVFEGKTTSYDDDSHLPVGDFLLYLEEVPNPYAAPYELLLSADVAALVDEPLSGHNDLQWLRWWPQQQGHY